MAWLQRTILEMWMRNRVSLVDDKDNCW
jgi:hypothetical protein